MILIGLVIVKAIVIRYIIGYELIVFVDFNIYPAFRNARQFLEWKWNQRERERESYHVGNIFYRRDFAKRSVAFFTLLFYYIVLGTYIL